MAARYLDSLRAYRTELHGLGFPAGTEYGIRKAAAFGLVNRQPLNREHHRRARLKGMIGPIVKKEKSLRFGVSGKLA